ncbi:MAG: FAD-dependent monooxygenase, partial [Proteobacteria bacterium]|nr:FAD-dependent monooxygenase [Pseudomonadota bacterium]
MRPAGRGDLDSLYFTYPKFAARRVAEQDGAHPIHPVVIVGAGPVGMTAALSLARHGVRSVLVDNKDTFNDGSRATCIARPSFQIFQQIGAVEPFLEKSLGWTRGRSYYRGSEIFRLVMPHADSERFLPMYNLQQQYTEQFLYDACAAQPDLIEFRWQSEVTGIETRADGATLTVATPTGDYPLAARYVLAADGARSAIRTLLGLRLQGTNYAGRYVIADVQMEHDFPTERRAFFEPKGNPGGTVLMHKQPDNIWRVDYQLKPGETPEEATREENIRARVGAILDDIGHRGPWDLEWWSIYTANTLCLDDYRHGPVLFIGDSGHIVPIFGVRGLNNGLADAHNAGWKLAYVLKGLADEKLLDSYSPERRGATLDVFANATKSTRFMTPPSRGWALVREAVLSLALREDFAKEFANPRQMTAYTYSDSPLTRFAARDGDFDGGAVCGAASPNAPLDDGSFLLDHAGKGFVGLFFCAREKDAPTTLIEALRKADPAFTALVITAEGGRLADPQGAIARIFAAKTGSAYLLRPDLHVAGRWLTLDAGE